MALEDIGVRAVIQGAGSFNRGIDGMQKRMGNFTSAVQRNSRQLKIAGAALTAFAVGVALVGFNLVKAASDAEEFRSKFDVVFGDLSNSVAAWAAETSKALNRSRFDFIKWLATLQDTFVPLGFSRDAAAEFSKSLVQLAVDVASFNNVSEADVIRDFQSALVGNTETVRKYGIVITEASTQQLILNEGWADSVGAITSAQKVQARLNLIMAGTVDAQGDAARTAGSFANQMRGLSATVEVLQVSLGRKLLPVAASIVGILTKLVGVISAIPEPLLTITVVAAGAAAAFAAIGGPILLLIGFLPQIAAGWTLLSGAMAASSAVMTGTLIPALVRVITTMWALVAARVAALAALGPVGWAILAGSVAAAAVGIAALVAKTRPNLPSFADGGTMIRSGLAVVGERGPEVVSLPGGATVSPVTNNTVFNVSASYARSQAPQSIRLDLEALAMSAGR